MEESTVQSDRSPGINDHVVLPNTSSIVSHDPFQDFRLFPFKFEESCFNRWYILLSSGAAILLLLDMLYDIQNKSLNIADGFEFSLTKSAFTDWLFISLVVALALSVLAFNKWRGTVPAAFKILLTKERVGSFHRGSDVTAEYHNFLREYQVKLLSNKRYLVIAISMATCFILFFLMASNRYFPPSALGFNDDSLYYFIVWIFWITLPTFFLGYFFGVAAWTIMITGLTIKSLTSSFDINIQPSHPDQCGGLKVLGDLCFGMALPVLIGATLLGIYGIGGIIYPELTRRLIVIPIAANIFLFLFALPLAAFAFFVPLWNIHCEMRRRREKYEDEFAIRIVRLEQKLRTSLDSGELNAAKLAKEEMEIVQVLHPDKIGYPLWPFDRRIMLTLLTTQIIPGLSLIVGLSGQWIKH